MSKMPIAWHEECLRNNSTSLSRLLLERQVLADRIEDMKANIQIYAYQIDEAKKRGLKEFDQERFGKKRGT